MKLFKNLAGYKNKELKEISIGENNYKTFTGFEPDFLIGFSFGTGTNKNTVNYQLSEAIVSTQKYFKDIPTFVQAEIGRILEKKQSNFYPLGKEYIYKFGDKSKLLSNIDSEGIIDIAIKEKECLNLGNKGLYVAHPAHIERILQISKKKDLESAPFIPSKILWNKKDIQGWTNSKKYWISREIPTRLHHKLTGKI